MRLLVIEDDKELCEILSYQFKKRDIMADFCYNGEDAAFYGIKNSYDIIILDRMLPGVDGLSILNHLRTNHVTTPIIMVTAMDTLKNRIEGLDTGADDYLTKPFEMEELFARIRALTRRPAAIEVSNLLNFSDFILNFTELTIETKKGKTSLSKRECDLLSFFINNKNQVLTREILLTRVWGADSFVTNGNLDNFICFLRKRLASIESTATIKTIRSVGYQLEE